MRGTTHSFGSKNNDRLIQKYVFLFSLCSDEMAAKIIAKDNAFRTAVRLFSLHKDVFLLKFVWLFDFSPFLVQKLKKIPSIFFFIGKTKFLFLYPILCLNFSTDMTPQLIFDLLIMIKPNKMTQL